MNRLIAKLALIGTVLLLTGCSSGGPFDFFKNFGKSSPPPRTVPLESDFQRPRPTTTEGTRSQEYSPATQEAPAPSSPQETVNPVTTPNAGSLSPLQAGPAVTPVPAGMAPSPAAKAAAPVEPERPGLIETGTMSPPTKKPHH